MPANPISQFLRCPPVAQSYASKRLDQKFKKRSVAHQNKLCLKAFDTKVVCREIVDRYPIHLTCLCWSMINIAFKC